MVSSVILAAALAAASTSPAVGVDETLLEVSATGRVKAVPDIAEVSIGVTSDGKTGRAAMAGNTETAARLIAAARAKGVPDASLRTERLTVSPVYTRDKEGDDTDQITGYRASNHLKVRMTNVANAPDVVESLVGAGATDLSGPDFSFSDDATLRRKARVAAVQSAAAEASDYAAALGMHISRILRVSERASEGYGGSDIVVTGARNGARASIQPGEQEISVTVWIDYALKAN